MICVNVYLGTLLKKMDFELIDGNKFFKVAWHNTSYGMKLMFLIKVVSLLFYKGRKTETPKPP